MYKAKGQQKSALFYKLQKWQPQTLCQISPFKLTSAAFSPRSLFPLTGIVDPQFSVQPGNTFGTQPAASRSVNAGLWLIFGCHQTILAIPSYGLLLPHLFTWQQTRAANQTGTIQTLHWESDTKGLRKAAKNSCSTYAPRQLPPGKHGKCHSQKLSWLLSCEELWCGNTEHKEVPPGCAAHHWGVCVLQRCSGRHHILLIPAPSGALDRADSGVWQKQLRKIIWH